MTDENRTSQRTKLEVIPRVSTATVQEFFTSITEKQIVYVCLVFTEKAAASLYMKQDDEDKKYHGIIRVFHRKYDAEHYARQVGILEDRRILAAKFSAFSLDAIFEKLAALKAGLDLKDADSPIVAMATVLEQDDFMDIGVLWSSEPNFML